jgi:hypothetical protein
MPPPDSLNTIIARLDSAQVNAIVDALRANKAPEITLIEKIDALYSRAFSDILLLVGVIITFVGVIMPLLMQFIQFRRFQREEEKTLKSIETVKDSALSAVEESKKQLAVQLKQVESRSAGATAHVQAISFKSDARPRDALHSILGALANYVHGNDHVNFARACTFGLSLTTVLHSTGLDTEIHERARLLEEIMIDHEWKSESKYADFASLLHELAERDSFIGGTAIDSDDAEN